MKDENNLYRKMIAGGWTLVRQSGRHRVLRCDCGEHQVTIPTSVSDHRGLKNKRAQLRRIGHEI